MDLIEEKEPAPPRAAPPPAVPPYAAPVADRTGRQRGRSGRRPGGLPVGGLRVGGSGRYAVALVVDALGAGLLRPFLLVYGVFVLGLSAGRTGLALSLGLLAGLAAVPLTGRWIDRGARTGPVVATLLVRAAGVAVLIGADGPAGFTAAVVLLGLGTQCWPTAHAALVAAFTDGRDRDTALATGRSLRNAGLGAGALIATGAVAAGPGALRGLAAVTGLACLLAAGLVHSLRTPSGGPACGAVPHGDTAGGPVLRDDTPDAPSPAPTPAPSPAQAPGAARRLRALNLANLPYAFCFDVLEVALPALLVTHLHASPAWASAVFVGNTLLVITAQVTLVRRLSGRPRRSVLAGSGLVLAAAYLGFGAASALGGSAGAVLLAAVAVPYTVGEMLYAGAGTALVVAAAPPRRLGRALARWELSTGIGRAAAPAVLTGLLAVGPGTLWTTLAAVTALAALAVRRHAPAV
ncbi:MFS transporter [Kitasatospora sp. NPDC054939]